MADQETNWKSTVSEAHGEIDAWVSVLVLPADRVRRLLPAGLELAPQPVVASGWHPIFIACGRNHFGAWFGDLDYSELMLGVPWVQLADPLAAYPGPFIYMPRLYLDAKLPRELGVRIYGWEKRSARIDVTGADAAETRYCVEVEGESAPALIGHFHAIPGVEPRPPAQVENFAIVRELFEQPTISQARRIVDADAFEAAQPGPFLATTVLWQVDLAGASVEPIRASLTIGSAFSPLGLPLGVHELPSLAEAELGAFRIRCKQFVSLPGPCAEARFPRPPAQRRRKVAILGGGPAACTAALYLAQQPDRYEVSLYTSGHRLGGKCQSWRNPDKAWRAEEHGLHAFLGFYRNAFTAVHGAYRAAFERESLGESMYAAAFHAEPDNGLMVERGDRWAYCSTPDFGEGSRATIENAGSGQSSLGNLMALISGRMLESLERITRTLPRLRRVLDIAKRASQQLGEGTLTRLRSVIALIVRASPERSTQAWFMWTGIDTTLTILIGLLRQPVRSLAELDAHDFRAWLRGHGSSEAPDESWATIDYVYETLFAHQPGFERERGRLETEVRPARLAAGVAMRWFLLEGLGYRDAPSFRFELSCGQTMMTPFYLALRRLGVKVHFFHTVTGLELAGRDADRRLTRIHMSRQAEVSAGAAEYQPLITTPLPNNPSALPDWPMDPDWSQLVEGDAQREAGVDFMDAWSEANTHARALELEQGKDFDLCVLGIPIGALPLIDSPLTQPDRPDADPAWKAMIEGTALTQTLSCQLWLRKPASELIAGKSRGLLTCFAQPQPSYGDFSRLLAHEAWTQPGGPQLLAYFTGASVAGKPPLPPEFGPDYPRRIQREWLEQVYAWLQAHHRDFFDGPGAPRGFEEFLELLAVEQPSESMPLRGIDRLAWQHVIAEVQPSSLYVLSQPGSTALRLGQAESGVKGLLLCGDWTRTDLNCGCVEAATSSGMLAARAISQLPRTIWRPGF